MFKNWQIFAVLIATTLTHQSFLPAADAPPPPRLIREVGEPADPVASWRRRALEYEQSATDNGIEGAPFYDGAMPAVNNQEALASYWAARARAAQAKLAEQGLLY